jgi:hypothetical protein
MFVIHPVASDCVPDVFAGDRVRENLRSWVTPPDPSTNHNIACGIQHDGTAQWFFQGGIFSAWKSTGSLLWIYGKRMFSLLVPDPLLMTICILSGLWEEHPLVSHLSVLYPKTNLRRSSAVIQDIETLRKTGSACMAYFYFDFRDPDKKNRRNLLLSLLVQLSTQSGPCCDALYQLYLEHDKGSRAPGEAALTQCLKDMLNIPKQLPIFIILDALDECPNSYGIPSPREQVLTLVKELINLRLPHLHFWVTSRPEFDIRATLGRLAAHSVSLHDESGQKQDIVDYVTSVVHSDSETMMKRWREEDKKVVVESLSEKADGM